MLNTVFALPSTRFIICSSAMISLASCGAGNSNNELVNRPQSIADYANQTALHAAVLSSVKKSAKGQDGIPGPFGQDASLYTLAFDDEFDGEALDTDKWTDHIWYDPPSETEDYNVSGGSLNIWPQQNADGEFLERILVTDGKYYQTYGYFEMEARIPVGAGIWPAFWLLNTDNVESEVPEIDIMEAFSGDTTGYWADEHKRPIRYNASWFEKGPNFAGDRDNHDPETGDLSSGFHIYAAKWEEDKVSFYFDGKLIGTSGVAMSKRMYILLDMQYGSASGSVDDSTPTGPENAFKVNYVRTWTFN